MGASIATQAAAQPSIASASQPSAAQPPNVAAETLPPADESQQQTSSGGDFMVDVLKTIGFDYVTQTKMSYAAYKRQLRNPINDMPPYPEKLLSEQEVADIYAYLQSVPGWRPVKDIPILDKN